MDAAEKKYADISARNAGRRVRDRTVEGSARESTAMRLLLARDAARLIVVGNACIRFGRTGAEYGLSTL